MRTGTILKVILKKVDKNQTEEVKGDPISQLQKVAVFRPGSVRDYLVMNDKRVIFQPSALPDPAPGCHQVQENGAWTICTCDRQIYTFYNPRFGQLNLSPPTPVPVVTMAKTLGNVVELYGDQFSTLLTVYFNTQPAETWYRCEELLMCQPPKYADVSPNGDAICRAPFIVELLLVRKDGFIYRTGQTYTYEVDHVAIVRSMAQQQLQLQQQQQQQTAVAAVAPMPLAAAAMGEYNGLDDIAFAGDQMSGLG